MVLIGERTGLLGGHGREERGDNGSAHHLVTK
jgi:hypothetical protein